jgi:nucleoside-diphosphate-sugar epimerase
MKVFVIGSTGFLGYYTVLELLKQGHEVESLALTPLPDQVRFPEGVGLTLANLNQMEDDEIVARLKGMEGLIFAAGVDDRVVPPKPAYQFFYEHNVLATRRLIRLARQAGVRRAVVFSSYFVWFARRWAELKLGETHPYIRSRLEQIQAANEEAGSEMTVSFLLLPYIFGALPGKVPLWKPLVNYINSGLPWVFYPDGGTAMVSVDEVARSAAVALARGESGMEYPVASHNLSWVELIGGIQKHLGKPKPVVTLPNWLVRFGARLLSLNFRLKGKESGLDAPAFARLQTSQTFLDTDFSASLLGYEHGDFDQALRETVDACLKG